MLHRRAACGALEARLVVGEAHRSAASAHDLVTTWVEYMGTRRPLAEQAEGAQLQAAGRAATMGKIDLEDFPLVQAGIASEMRAMALRKSTRFSDVVAKVPMTKTRGGRNLFIERVARDNCANS